MRVLYLSSVPALDTTASPVVVRRHLDRLVEAHELCYVTDQPDPPPYPRQLRVGERPWLRRLRKTRITIHVQELHDGLARGFDLAPLHRLIRAFQPEVLLTVALGPLHIVARRMARIYRCPLVTLFHDWSPGWFTHSELARRLTARQLRLTYGKSAVSLCITPEFRAHLGSAHPASRVLPPIPAGDRWSGSPAAASARLAVYAGVAHGVYQSQTQALANSAASLGGLPSVRFFGPPPSWDPHVLGRARAAGLMGGFLERAELERTLAAAPALLACVPFGSATAPIAHFSFPSKLTEYCRFARPIVLWAPRDAAASHWARRSGAARLVDSPDPAAVIDTLEGLARDPVQGAELSRRAAACIADEFAPAKLQRIFEDALREASDFRQT